MYEKTKIYMDTSPIIPTCTCISCEVLIPKVRYRSIITSFLHASPRVMPRVFRMESAKIYRGNLNFHMTGRGFSTRGLVALHDTWHFHERTHASSTNRGSSTRRIMAFPQDESWNFHEMSRGVYMQRLGKPTRNFDVVTRVVVHSRSLCNASVGARHMVNSPWLVTAFTYRV